MEATGGWVTGVLFEAWRSAEHVPGMGGEADPLHGYLSAQMLGELCDADRDFLIETAILHEVNAVRAAALGRADAGERLASLRAAHLPVAWTPGQLSMRCHPRFHEYLRRPARAPAAASTVRALRLAHGRLLADRGPARGGDRGAAARERARARRSQPARRAIFSVIERVDYATAERWIETLAPVVPRGAHDWAEAELLLAFTHLDYARSLRISDRLAGARRARAGRGLLRARGRVDGVELPRHARTIEDSRAVLARGARGPAVAAVRYRAWLTYNVVPGEKPVAPARTGRARSTRRS